VVDVEFYVPGDGEADADDEVLDTGKPGAGHRRLLGWAVVVCAAAAVAGLVAGTHGHGHPRVPQVEGLLPVVVPDPTPARVLPDSAPAAVVDGAVVALAGNTLVWRAFDGTTTAHIPIDDPSANYTLVADPAGHRVWLVRLGPASMRVTTYDRWGPERESSFGNGSVANDAAVLDGSLWVDTDGGVQRVSSGATGGSMDDTGMPGGYAITADPSRHRLLLVDYDSGLPRIRVQDPGRAAAVGSVSAPFGKGELVVVGGRIWAAGYSSTGAVLARLNPRTLRPVQHSPLESYLGPGAIVAAIGSRDLIVRSGAGGQAMWCIDARDGTVQHVWSEISGSVVVVPDGGARTRSGVYLATGEGAPVRLDSSGCPG
jgi:hypothetical protein